MEISIIILCLILCAFFSGMEIAFISSNKIYLEIEKKQDNFISKILTKLTEKPSKFIAAMLIGNNIALVVYGFFMGELLMGWIDVLGYHFSRGHAPLTTILQRNPEQRPSCRAWSRAVRIRPSRVRPHGTASGIARGNRPHEFQQTRRRAGGGRLPGAAHARDGPGGP